MYRFTAILLAVVAATDATKSTLNVGKALDQKASATDKQQIRRKLGCQWVNWQKKMVCNDPRSEGPKVDGNFHGPHHKPTNTQVTRHEDERGADFGYRIADTVRWTKAWMDLPDKTSYWRLEKDILTRYPSSIAAAYIKGSRILGKQCGTSRARVLDLRMCYDAKIHVLDDILRDKCSLESYSHSTVVHLRMGDALCVNTSYAQTKLRPPSPNEAAEVIVQHETRTGDGACLILFSTHGGCIDQSTNYVERLHHILRQDKRGRNITYTIKEGSGWLDADADFCSMVNAQGVFVRGSGGFSYVASKVRQSRNLTVVEELVHSNTPIKWLDELDPSALKELPKQLQISLTPV